MVRTLLDRSVLSKGDILMITETDYAAAELLKTLSTVAKRGAECIIESDGTDHSLECDTFMIALELDDAADTLQIRKLETFGDEALGKRIMKAIHRFADEHHLGLTVSSVRDEDIIFWQQVGYVECSMNPGEFFRVK